MSIVKGDHKKVVVAILATYLLMSFVPQIGLLNLFSGLKGKGGSGGKIL